MASIAEWIEKIKTAIYGEEVRGAIWQSLDAMNTQVDAINVDSAQIEQNKQDIATNTAAITALNSSKRYYVNGSAPILAIKLSNTIDGQNYVLTNTRGDAIQLTVEGSTLTIVKYNVSHDGTYEAYRSGSIIYVGIKFGSSYGTQGWSVFGPNGFNYSLSRVASIPSGATEATVITSQMDALEARVTALENK